MAQPFDPDRLTLAGEAVSGRRADGKALGSPPFGFFPVSDSGVLAYQTGTANSASQLTWRDRAGRLLTTVGDPALYSDLGLSPDGSTASVGLRSQGTGGGDVWLLNLTRNGLATRFTFHAATDGQPLWSPDGSRIVFISNRTGNFDLYQKTSSGAGGEDLLLADKGDSFVDSWSPDGRFLLYENVQGTAGDIWVLPLFGDGKPFPLPSNGGQRIRW